MPVKHKILREPSSNALDSSFEFESSVEIISSCDKTIYQRQQSNFISINQNGHVLQNGSSNQNGFMDQFIMPRPSYYSLRLLGVWQPKNSHLICKMYSGFCYFILLLSMVSILGMYRVCYRKPLPLHYPVCCLGRCSYLGGSLETCSVF